MNGGVFMDNHSSGGSGVGKSTLAGFNENIAAALTGGLTLVASFIPYVSWFAWIIPAIASAVERKSKFVRLCCIQVLVCAATISICSLATVCITPYAQAAEGGSLISFGAAGVIMSLLRVACLVFEILTAYHAYKMKIFEIPLVTLLIKKIIKYSNY